MKRTSKYDLAYFEQDDRTSSVYEMQRWETLDAQLRSLFDVLGNGVLEGWDILPSSSLAVVITPGKGHVNFVAVESIEAVSITDLLPNTRNYLYASLTLTSYWDKSVNFVSLGSEDTTGELLFLGYVDTDLDSVTDVNIDDRSYLGFLDLIRELISDHRHIGGTGNPPPVDLSSEVQGIINQNNLPDLDASIIQTGTIDEERLPLIDHITKLINQGTLTHAQLDSFVEGLSIVNPMLMGETSTINLLQLILALKHVYPDIDEFLVNEIAYIPGISPDEYVDWDNTTADVDVSVGGEHTITGAASTGQTNYIHTWDTADEFESGTQNNVIIDGDNVCLDVQESSILFDDFVSVAEWQISTSDLSSVSADLILDATDFVEPPSSGKLTVGNTQVDVTLLLKKEFDAMDWTEYNYMTLYLKTESVEHGDIIFYLNDAFAGIQDSYTKVLNRNAPTINVDTLQDGWQEVTIDISSFTKDNINTIGFYVSTQDGWDTSKGLDFNIDKITLTAGNKFKDDGYVRLIYGNGSLSYSFNSLRWNAIIPSATGLIFKVRTRVSNTLAGLSIAIWSPYLTVSGDSIILPASGLYKYIEIETYFEASDDLSRSACLKKLFLDFSVSDIDSSFEFDTKDYWDSGNTFNIDTVTVPNSMLIAKPEEVNDIFYGSDGHAMQLDDDLTQLYKISGSVLPRSTEQAKNDTSPSLGLITGVSRGNQGNVWLSDVDNDRIVELDKSGALVRGFYGTFLSAPEDTYGVEESGPGSNQLTEETTTTTTTPMELGEILNVLQAIYNSSDGILYIVFDADLENIYDGSSKLNMDRIYIKIGTQRFYLTDSTVELLGIDETKYDNWISLTESSDDSAEFINQFDFKSHTLKITLDGADKTLLNYMVNDLAPSVVIANPYEQKQTEASLTVQFLIYNFEIGTGIGGIRVTLDGSNVQDIYSDNVSYSGLSDGAHTIKAQLLNGDSTLNTNIEAIAEGSFVVATTSITEPYISITTPKPNQIYSSSPIVVEFDIQNFSIIPTDQHVRYQLDTDAPVDHYSIDPISIDDISAGEHLIKVYLVDKNGDDLGYTYGSSTAGFIVGLNSNARTKLYVDPEAVYDTSGKITTSYIRQDVDVANIYFSNIYSPIDIQVVPVETSAVNLNGLPTVLVSKMRSKSWLEGLGDQEAVDKFIDRITPTTTTTTTTAIGDVTTTTTTTTPMDEEMIPIAELIFGTKYLDGHSVVQLDMSGETIFSNNAAIFATSKETAKTLLGSAQKLGNSEILIGDSYNKRAIITYTDLETEKPLIEWEYNSDRYISDFHIILQDDKNISVGNDAISDSNVFIRQGSEVIWENNSVSPISIYSGTTTYDQFQLDPDLNLYGSIFKSSLLQPGERYTYKFVTVGEFDWFVYPGILTGRVNVTKNRISNTDNFIILENDGLDSPFSSRVIKVDAYGNVLWSFGESYLVKPRDARPLLNDGVIIST